jgi:hypothetical protein
MAHSEPSFVAKISSWFFAGSRVTESSDLPRAITRRWEAPSVPSLKPHGEHVPALAAPELDNQQQAAAVFSGPVVDIPIAELVQTIGMGRKDGVITVRHAGRESRIWCLGGEVVDAESGQLSGDLAFYRIIGIDAGHVRADFHTVPRMRIIHASTQALVLEAARRKDECDLLRKRLGSGHPVYSPAAKPLVGARHGRTELGLLRAFYPGATLDEVLADNHVGDLEALRILVTLIEQEWLVPNHALTAQRVESSNPVALASARSAAPGFSKRRSLDTLQPYLAQGYAARARGSTKGIVVATSALLAAGTAIALARVRTPVPDGSRTLAASAARVAPSPATPEESGPVSAARAAVARAPIEAPPTSLPGPAASLPDLLVEVETVPIEATLWLDGASAAQGRLSLRLPRDGRTHEMRVTAPGYGTERIVFSDTPPPSLITLVPAAKAEQRAPERSAEVPTTPPPRLAARHEKPRTLAKASPAAPGTGASLASVARIPRVQIIANEDPAILVLE